MENRNSFQQFAYEALSYMKSYGVEPWEIRSYLRNETNLCGSSYELQCCIFDNDPVEYYRQFEKTKDKK